MSESSREDEVADLRRRLRESEAYAAALHTEVHGTPRMMGLRETLGRVQADRDAANGRASTAVSALKAVLADPHGCPMCDSGKLRASAVARGADHWPACAYPKARDALQKAGVLP